jgi:type II secretory pathway pseudopilin PulG
MVSKGFPLKELLMVLFVAAIITALAIPGLFKAQRAAHERQAMLTLGRLVSVQVKFKTTDCDGDGIANYWVGDLAGLDRIAEGNTATNPGIKLLEADMASADAAARSGRKYGTTNFSAVTTIAEMAPRKGYWFRVLDHYETAAGTVKYDDGSGKHADQFGAITVPHSYGNSGRPLFILNEEGTMFKKDAGAQFGDGGSNRTGFGKDPGCWVSEFAMPRPGTLGGTYAPGSAAINTYPLKPFAPSGWAYFD